MTTLFIRGDSVVNADRASKADVLLQYVVDRGEIESAKPEHITAACNVLMHSVLERAGT